MKTLTQKDTSKLLWGYAAVALHITMGQDVVKRFMDRGDIPCIKLNGVWVTSKEEVEDWERRVINKGDK